MTTMWIAITSLITVALLAMFIIIVTVFGLIAGHLIVALTISLVVLGGSAFDRMCDRAVPSSCG